MGPNTFLSEKFKEVIIDDAGWGDPMCSIVLDEKTAKFRINFEGETYYCSVNCKKKFKHHPRKFVK